MYCATHNMHLVLVRAVKSFCIVVEALGKGLPRVASDIDSMIIACGLGKMVFLKHNPP